MFVTKALFRFLLSPKLLPGPGSLDAPLVALKSSLQRAAPRIIRGEGQVRCFSRPSLRESFVTYSKNELREPYSFLSNGI